MQTYNPVGVWVIQQALSVLFTCYPPGPYEVVYSISNSFIFNSKLKGTYGRTTNTAVEEWSLPLPSVLGILITLWTPASQTSYSYMCSPVTISFEIFLSI